MVKGLYTAYTGMLNEQHRMDVLSNNMANVTTVGYKKEGTTSQSFDEVLDLKIKDSTVGYRLAQREGYNSRGVKIGENYVDWSQGSFRITDNTFDLALSDRGFFAVEFTNKAGETSTMYTRAGEFELNTQGYLVTHEGDYVLDENNRRIQIDTLADTTIDREGNIFQNDRLLTKIRVVDFADYDYLEKYGEVYYTPIEGAQVTTSDAKVYSGYLEAANVSVVSEMVNLIAISRQYESNQKVIQTIDSTLDVAVNQIGKV
ncbi:MAG: flagellar hook-basal body protein [Lachnospiraceae bacterium]|nr:flagellar hook-basal body protein [Lachnospiraceae bacterium]MCR5476461.1 flagellar hook-basal body protein [Lachnospiraceae bacterium]